MYVRIAAVTAAALVVFPQAAHAASGRPQEMFLTKAVRYGSTGPDVRRLQQRLRAMKIDPGPVNGRFGAETRAALWAFEKANGLRPRDVTTGAVRRALARPRPIRALVARAPAHRVEISLRRQLLVVWKKGRPALVTHISTGTNRRYCERGHCGLARTPRGDFRAYRKVRGWDDGPLGSMYFPTYFNGGIAMHGSINVPTRRASHGCIRIPMHNAKALYRLVPKATRVYVR